MSQETFHYERMYRVDFVEQLQAEVEQLRQELGLEQLNYDTLRQRCEALEADKARLDWLESRKTEVHFWNKNGNRKCSFIEDWDSPEAVEALREADTLRAAIDAAVSAQPHAQGNGGDTDPTPD